MFLLYVLMWLLSPMTSQSGQAHFKASKPKLLTSAVGLQVRFFWPRFFLYFAAGFSGSFRLPLSRSGQSEPCYGFAIQPRL